MHEEIQQWDIHPKFPLNPLVSILLGVLTGLAFGYLIQNLLFGAVLGLVVGVATTLAMSRESRDRRAEVGGGMRLWALAPLLGFMICTVLLWVYQFV